MWVRSASSKVVAGSPRLLSAARAIDSALETDRAAARGSRSGKSSSQARSRLTRRPGLTRTSWQSRRALGRGHGPAARPPETTENGPSSLTRTATSPLSRTSSRALSHAAPALCPVLGPTGTPREQRLPSVQPEPQERGFQDEHGVHDLPGRAAQVRARAARDRHGQRQAGRGGRAARPLAGPAGASPAPDLAAGAGTPGPLPRVQPVGPGPSPAPHGSQ